MIRTINLVPNPAYLLSHISHIKSILSVGDFDRLLIICNPFFRSKFKSSLMKIVISGPAVHRGIVGIFPHLILADTLTLFQSD